MHEKFSSSLHFTSLTEFDLKNYKKQHTTPHLFTGIVSIQYNRLLLPLIWTLSLTASVQCYKPYSFIDVLAIPSQTPTEWTSFNWFRLFAWGFPNFGTHSMRWY